MSKDFHDIIINIVAGLIGAILVRGYLFILKGFQNHEFKRMFGDDALSEFHIVYGRMVLKQLYSHTGQIEQWPYLKLGTNKHFRISSPVSFTETKSAKYLSEAFSRRTKYPPVLISDDEVKEKLDLSFCSFGGYNNLKTIDILDNEKNKFYEFDLLNQSIISRRTGSRFQVDSKIDYGVIIKIHHKSFMKRTHICVAGLGEFGTSGAAWYLSNKWRTIFKQVGDNEFGCLIKVIIGQDQSAELIDILL